MLNPKAMVRFMNTQGARYPLVWGTVAVCCLVFALLQFTGLRGIDGLFMPASGQSLSAKPWSLITPVFVHYTVFHIVTNLYLWWLLARQIETFSTLELANVALLCGVLGNLCQWLMVSPYFGGLSGVVYGVLGYVWVTVRRGVRPFRVDPVLAIIMVALIPLAATGKLGKYATYAHLGGLLVGALLGFFARPRRQD